MIKELRLIEEMTKEELEQIEKEIEAGTCKVGLSAKEMYNSLVENGILEKPLTRQELKEEECLEILNSYNEKLLSEEKPGIAPLNIYNDLVEQQRWNINLHKHMTSWAVYKPGVVPVKGNQCGYLAPYNYGGLGYRCYNASFSYTDVFNIPTGSWGEVQIYCPKDQDACRAYMTSVYPWGGDMQIDGKDWVSLYKGKGGWGNFGCLQNYSKTPAHTRA